MNPFPTNRTPGSAAKRIGRSTLRIAITGVTLTLCAAAANAADNRKETKLELAPGGNITIVNGGGSVLLRSAFSGRQVDVAYTTHSDKVEVDVNATADKQRIELRTHTIAGQKPTPDEAKVDFEISVPPGAVVNVSTLSAPVTAEGVSGDITLSSESGQIDVHNMTKSHLHARSMSAPVSLTGITNTHVDVQSSGGAVHMSNVTGPRVSVGTTSGNVDYRGDCSGGGDYLFTTHSGEIDMWLPKTASVELLAHSRTGAVENEFPLQEKTHPSLSPPQGRSFAGTSNSGSSSVELQSINGKIRVKKQ
ncbi:MAG TPA: DUF4097 family beta strand repeat-containing protein [Candidatus Angelobacter sp.]|nr:DUF4097 family beta strand repeat-containing protein [Candidatus Angelobacter sp.]